MGLSYGINNSLGKIPEKSAHLILKKAYDSGVAILDSAKVYGKAHKIIGSYHQQYLNKFIVNTKFPNMIMSDKIRSHINAYLMELNVDQLGTIMFHSFNSLIENKGLLSELASIKKEGLIQKIGVSIYDNSDFETVINNEKIDVIQIPFNLLDNFSQKGALIIKAKSSGKEIHARSVFLQGLFFINEGNQNPIYFNLKNEINELKLLAKEHNYTISELALSYCLNQINIDKVIIGVDSLIHLNNNLKAAELLLDNELEKRINKINIKNTKLLNPSLW